VDSTHLVTHNVRLDVLLCSLLRGLGLLECLLQHVWVGLSGSADSEVHSWSHLLDLDARQLLSALLCSDQVDSQVDLWSLLLAINLIAGRDGNNVLQSLDIDLVRWLALEEIDEEALCVGVLIGDRAFEWHSAEDQHRLQSDGTLGVLELRQSSEALLVEVEFQHVQHLVAKGAHHGERMWALLGGGAKDEDGGVVLLGEELEGSGIVEWVDIILLGELLGKRAAQRVKICEGVLGKLGARGAAKEKRSLRVLDGLGGLLVEGTLGARIAGFTARTV
jgi:hypothetical protein